MRGKVRLGTLAEAQRPIYWTESKWADERKLGIMVGCHPTRDGAGIVLWHDKRGVVWGLQDDEYSAAYFRGEKGWLAIYGVEREIGWFIPARLPVARDPNYWAAELED